MPVHVFRWYKLHLARLGSSKQFYFRTQKPLIQPIYDALMIYEYSQRNLWKMSLQHTRLNQSRKTEFWCKFRIIMPLRLIHIARSRSYRTFKSKRDNVNRWRLNAIWTPTYPFEKTDSPITQVHSIVDLLNTPLWRWNFKRFPPPLAVAFRPN